MIVIAIVSIIVIFLALGTSTAYFSQRDDVTQRQEQSNSIQNERVKEQLELTYHNTTHGLEIFNEWGQTSGLTGLMVICDNDGNITKHTVEFERNVAWNGTRINTTEIVVLRAMC